MPQNHFKRGNINKVCLIVPDEGISCTQQHYITHKLTNVQCRLSHINNNNNNSPE